MDNQTWEILGDIITSYLHDNSSSAVQYLPAEKLKDELKLDINLEAGSIDSVIEFVKKYLKYSVNTNTVKFSNQLYGGYNKSALIGEIITTITNASMATYEIAPVASLIEQKLVEFFANQIGYQEHDGIMLTGGSNANLMALIAARNTLFPNTKNEGLKENICAFVSDQAHYSFKKAFHILGLGQNNLILVKSNSEGDMCTKDLENKIKQAIKENKKPFFINATAGTTVFGAFDPIEETAEIAKLYNCWFHIDGAWGGSLLLSSQKDLLKGSHLADSFTWDAHKMMNIPMICSFFLTKHANLLLKMNSGGGSKYIFHEYENKYYDYGPKSLQCGRRVDSLKLYLTILEKGINGITKEIDHLYHQAQLFKKMIIESDDFELIHSPQSMNVCFRYIKTDQELNKFNILLRERLVQDGEFLVNYSDNNGIAFFRQIFINPQINENYSMLLLEKLRNLAIW